MCNMHNILDARLPGKTRTCTCTPGIATKVYPRPGNCSTRVHNSQRFRVGYEILAELTELPGTNWMLYRTHKSIGYGHGTRTPGTGMNFLQIAQNFRVRVRKSYRTQRSVDTTTEVSGTGNTRRLNTPGNPTQGDLATFCFSDSRE